MELVVIRVWNDLELNPTLLNGSIKARLGRAVESSQLNRSRSSAQQNMQVRRKAMEWAGRMTAVKEQPSTSRFPRWSEGESSKAADPYACTEGRGKCLASSDRWTTLAGTVVSGLAGTKDLQVVP